MWRRFWVTAFKIHRRFETSCRPFLCTPTNPPPPWPWGRLSLRQKWVPGKSGWQSYHLLVPIVWKSVVSTSWNPQGLSRPVQGLFNFTFPVPSPTPVTPPRSALLIAMHTYQTNWTASTSRSIYSPNSFVPNILLKHRWWTRQDVPKIRWTETIWSCAVIQKRQTSSSGFLTYSRRGRVA